MTPNRRVTRKALLRHQARRRKLGHSAEQLASYGRGYLNPGFKGMK